jgi:hypothetical protein
MRKSSLFAGFALVVALSGASVLSAQERYGEWRDIHHDRQDLRRDYRDVGSDYAQADRLRADIARDRGRLNENIRCGREWAAQRDAADLARDQRALNGLSRDIRHDPADMYRDRRDLHRDYREAWR